MLVALRVALQSRQPGTEVQVIETHISFVFIAGEFAYKFKKVLSTGFLDFTTLERRRHFCQEELRLNRRLAPQLYLDVVAVTGSVDAPQLGGTGTLLDCAVRMRAFAQDGLWDRMAARGELRPVHVDALVALLGDFHRHAAVADAAGRFGRAEQVRAPMLDNLAQLPRGLSQRDDLALLEALRNWEAQAFAALDPLFAQRLRDGWVRECHGDLHLGNVTQIDGQVTVFDCIEFNDEFRWIDVMSELAFMAMDLHNHGCSELANRFVNACLERSGDYAGVRVLRYYMVYRALVRAKVAALRAHQAGSAGALDAARHCLRLAVDASRPPAPALMITHGLSGSGKTTLTQGLLEATGAIRIRADVERKRLFGLDALERGGAARHAELYGTETTMATYAHLREAAAAVLDGGHSVLLDATFLQRAQRDAARQLAAARKLRLVILDFEAAPEMLRERVRQRAARGNDASDADLRVLEAQLRTVEPLGADEQAAVFRCRPADAGEVGEPHADWSALLRSLG
jgi:aminoglycoside phosphotransferase family enzyme/predicted kinase